MTDQEIRDLVDDLRYTLEDRLRQLAQEVDLLRRTLLTHTREHGA